MRLMRFVKEFLVLFPLLLTFTSSIPDKVCKGDVILDSSNIDSFKDCTTINGTLYIENVTFTGNREISKMDPGKLEVFSTVKEIAGILYVTASHPNFTDLHYFRNLQICGQDRHLSAVHITGTSLQSLRLLSLKRIAGDIVIVGNFNLCFAERINWQKLLNDLDSFLGISWHESLYNPGIQVENNRHKDACFADNMVCHEKCLEEDGCWGPGVDECLSCKGFSLAGTCVDSCSYPGIYQSGDKTCAKCHEECDGICTGPGPGNCTKCPSMTYKMVGDCVQCNETCVGGCTGPGDFLGYGGCDKVMGRNNIPKPADARVRFRKTDEPCREGNFSVLINVTGSTKSWECRPCHPSCKKCTGDGSHLSVCIECAQLRSEEQCEDQCPNEYYTDNAAKRCIRCSSECKGCWGPRSDQCESCRNLKVPLGDNITHEFNCSATCPEDKPQTRQDQGGPYCSAKDPVEEISVSAISGVVVACTFLIGMFAAAYRYRCWQRTCLRENTVKTTMPLRDVAGLEESDPLKTSHVELEKFTDYQLCNENIMVCGALGGRHDPVCATDEKVDNADGTILVNLEEPVNEQGNSGGSQRMWSEAAIGELTEKDMTSIAEHLANKDWKKVGQNLAVPYNRLDEIESQYRNDYRECAVQMLRIWRESSPKCTLQDLFDALKQLGLESSTEKIKKIVFSKQMTQK